MKWKNLVKPFVLYGGVTFLGITFYPQFIGTFGSLGATVGTAVVAGLTGVVLDYVGATKAI